MHMARVAAHGPGTFRRWTALLLVPCLLALVPLASASAATDPWSSDPAVTPRLGSDDVIATSVAVSQVRFEAGRASHVVLSRSDVFADALAGSALTSDGPLLLTASASLDGRVRAEIARVLPSGGEVVLLGGPGALAPAVADRLTADGYEVHRLSGPDRRATAAAIAAEVRRREPDAGGTVLVARAFGTATNPTAAWADSVSAGAWSAATGHPLVLSDSGALSPEAAGILADATRVVLLGGTSALSARVEQDVRALGVTVERVAGATRDATAAAIRRDLWRHTAPADGRVVLVPGWHEDGWAHGLVAGGLASDHGAALLLVATDDVPDATAAAVTSCGVPNVDTLVVAGTSAVSDQVRTRVEQLDGGDCTRSFDVRWSDPGAWPSGRLPRAGEAVQVPAGVRMLLDVDPPALARLTVGGTLVLDDRDTELTADTIVVTGGLEIGTAAAPHRHRATITLTGPRGDAPAHRTAGAMGTRGLVVVGDARLRVHADPPRVPWTRLADHAVAGASALSLIDDVGWSAGDRVLVAPTDFYRHAATEVRTLATRAGDRASLTSALAQDHWGRLQYVTPNGLSLDAAAPRVAAPTPGTPTVLDERAEVANLTRNVVIQSVDDDAWRTYGFGAHVMIMDRRADVHLDGVAIRRAGQAGLLGRYPMHWHEASYDGTTEVGDAGDVLRRSVIEESSQRCVVVHATNGVRLEDNICRDIVGHAFFLEDAVERRNVMTGNLVATVRNPAAPLKVHESDIFQGGSSGFWLTNPDNVVTGNVVTDAEGVGFWLSFPRTPLGTHADVPMIPANVALGTFADNVAHSNQKLGLNLDWVVVDDAGNVTPNSFVPKSDEGASGETWDHERWLRVPITRFTSYKHGQGGMWNRVAWPDYVGWVSADNVGTYFAGAGADGLITGSLLVQTSLNDATTWDRTRDAGWIGGPVAFASYHSTFDMRDNVVVNFDFRIDPEGSGAFKTDDYYVRPVDKGTISNPGNVLVDSHPGYRIPRPATDWALAGALWDPHGYWGPAGNWWVYDDPFLTHDRDCVSVAPAGSNGASCPGNYLGIKGFQLDQANEPWAAYFTIDVTRQDVATGAAVGSWRVDAAPPAQAFSNMRHFAAAEGGRYLVDFPGQLPTDVVVEVENALTADDHAVLGVRFDGSHAAGVFATSGYNAADAGYELRPQSQFMRHYDEVSSLGEVLASDGEVFWQDADNDLVWLKLAGGLPDEYVESSDPLSDERLYELFKLRIH